MANKTKPNYLAKVKLLSKEDTERLLSRMGGKLPRRLEKRKLSQDEALAMQLELEDQQLNEWRKVMHNLKKKEKAKAAKEAKKSARKSAKKEAKNKASATSKVKVKAKTKPKVKAKSIPKAKAKSPAKAPPKVKPPTEVIVEPGK